MSIEGYYVEMFSLGNQFNLKYVVDLLRLSVEMRDNFNVEVEEYVNGKIGVNGLLNVIVIEKKKTVKIYDFCFGILFGEYVDVLVFGLNKKRFLL